MFRIKQWKVINDMENFHLDRNTQIEILSYSEKKKTSKQEKYQQLDNKNVLRTSGVITWYRKVRKLADWELFWYQKALLRHHSFGTKVHYQPANKDRISSDELHVFQRTSQIEHCRTKHTKTKQTKHMMQCFPLKPIVTNNILISLPAQILSC